MSREKHYSEEKIKEALVIDYFYNEIEMDVINKTEKNKHEKLMKSILNHIENCDKCMKKYNKIKVEIEQGMNNSCGSCCSNCSGCN